MRVGRLAAALAFTACTESTPEPAVRFGPDTGRDETGGDGGEDTGEPAGTLGLVQILCEGWIGEAMLIVGPDGTRVLLDVGNDSHGDIVSDAVSAYTGADSVDAVVLTHFHEDHAGGLNKLSVPFETLVSRGAVGLGGEGLPDGFEGAKRVDLCTESACSLPYTLPLGSGAELVIFAANGEIDGERFDPLPNNDDGENARSLVGVVRWGEFVYLWNGDLSGGGDDTPDMEGFYATRMDAYVPDTGATVGHLGHHGIDDSTSEAWVDRVFPARSGPHAALVGSNMSYRGAPSEEVLDRVRDRVEGVWVTQPSAFTPSDPILHEADGDVVIAVTGGGSEVRILAGGEETLLVE